MVLNEIVRGAAGIAVATEGEIRNHSITQEDLKEAVTFVMEEYTSLRNWHLITVSEETERDRQDQQVRTGSPSGFNILSPGRIFPEKVEKLYTCHSQSVVCLPLVALQGTAGGRQEAVSKNKHR